MRFASAIALAVVLVLPRGSDAQTSLDGFGALSMNQLSSLGESGVPVDFGGRVSFELVPGVQAIGEFGRLGNVLPSVVALPLSFSPVDLKVSAFYGEGGVRLLAAPRSAVSPYVEGTAGVAHLRFGLERPGIDGRRHRPRRAESGRHQRSDAGLRRRRVAARRAGSRGRRLPLQADPGEQYGELNPQCGSGASDPPGQVRTGGALLVSSA